jgi:hypothetical protein
MRFTKEGRLGIGQTNPSYKLDVAGTARFTGDITGNLVGNVTGDITGNLVGNVTGTILTAAQSNITSVGSLTSLDTTGSIKLNNAQSNLILKTNSNDTDDTNSILFQNSGNAYTWRIGRRYNTTYGNTSADASLVFSGGDASTTGYTNLADRVCFHQNGNVGIGTNNPTATLHLGGQNEEIRFGDGATNRSSLVFKGHNTGTTFVDRYAIKSVSGSSGEAHVWYDDQGTAEMTLLNNGNLGIGTTTPVETLGVHGSARFGNDGKLTIDSRTTEHGSETVALQTTIDNKEIGYDLVSYGGVARHVLALQPDGGYVGIGTTSPNEMLELRGSLPKILLNGGEGDGGGELNFFNRDSNNYMNWPDRTILGEINFMGQEAVSGDTATGYGLAKIFSRIQGRIHTDNGSSNAGWIQGGIGFYTNEGDGNSTGTTGNNLLERMTLDYRGYLGIGTTAPGKKLHVIETATGSYSSIHNAMRVGVDASARGSIANGFGVGLELWAQRGSAPNDTATGRITSYLLNQANTPHDIWGMGFQVRDNDTWRTPLILMHNGNITMGTGDMEWNKNAKFWVEGTTGYSQSNTYQYLNDNSNNHGPATASVAYSIGCSGRIRATEFNATSDERKKKDFVEILDNTALDLVNQLKVYNYKWKGELCDTTLKTGVKAQEVEAIYPSCITQMEEAIPSILEKVVYNSKKFNLTDVSDLVVGDKLKIFYNDKVNLDEKELTATIVNIVGNEVEIYQEIKDDNDEIYIYGKYCNDVKTIDYNSLNMLSIGAVKSLTGKNNVLENKVSTLENKVATLETELAAIKSHLGL